MRYKFLTEDLVTVAQVFSAAAVLRFSVLVEFNCHRAGRWVQLAFHVAAKIKITSMGNAFELTIFPFWKKRERVFDISSTNAVVGKFFLVMLSHDQGITGKSQ